MSQIQTLVCRTSFTLSSRQNVHVKSFLTWTGFTWPHWSMIWEKWWLSMANHNGLWLVTRFQWDAIGLKISSSVMIRSTIIRTAKIRSTIRNAECTIETVELIIWWCHGDMMNIFIIFLDTTKAHCLRKLWKLFDSIRSIHGTHQAITNIFNAMRMKRPRIGSIFSSKSISSWI